MRERGRFFRAVVDIFANGGCLWKNCSDTKDLNNDITCSETSSSNSGVLCVLLINSEIFINFNSTFSKSYYREIFVEIPSFLQNKNV